MTEKKEKKVTERAQEEARKLGYELREVGRDVWLATLGVVATVEEESRGLYDRLVARGGKIEKKTDLLPLADQWKEMRGRFEEAGERFDQRFQDATHATLERFGVPSSRDVKDLIHRVEDLTQQVESLAGQR